MVILVISCTLFLEIYNIWGGGQCNTNLCYCEMLCTFFLSFFVCVQDQVLYNLQIFIIIIILMLIQ